MSVTLSISVDRVFATMADAITGATAALATMPTGITHIRIYDEDDSPAPGPAIAPADAPADTTAAVEAPAPTPVASEPAPDYSEVKAQVQAAVAKVLVNRANTPRMRELVKTHGGNAGISSIPGSNLAAFLAASHKEFPNA